MKDETQAARDLLAAGWSFAEVARVLRTEPPGVPLTYPQFVPVYPSPTVSPPWSPWITTTCDNLS